MKIIIILGENDKLSDEQIQEAHLIIDANKAYISKNYLGAGDYTETRTEVLSQIFINYLNSEVNERK